MKSKAIYLACILGTVPISAYADISGNPEKISGWVVAYETDSTGATVRGSLDRLISAVRSGADIKVGIGAPATAFRPCDFVDIFTDASSVEHVGCSLNNTPAAILGSLDPLTLRANPYIAYQWFDTLRRSAIVRVSIFGGASQGSAINAIGSPMIWFAKVR